MAIFESAFTIYANRDRITKILKWLVLIAASFLFFIYLILATIIAVMQGVGKVSTNTEAQKTSHFSPFQYFSYKTINGDTWYEFNHPYVFPTLGVLTQGVLLDVSKDGLKHIAWDIADRPTRQTEVKAFSDGVVSAVKTNMLYNTTRRWKFCDNGVGICWYEVTEAADVQIGCGNEIIISHPDSLTTEYCHLDSSLVKVGDQVTAGDVIGIQGSTGWATGKHLHFALWRDYNPIDPSYAFSQTSLNNWNQ